MAQANEQQVGGTHYKGGSRSGQQHWDMAWDFGLDFFQYQITRYLFRWRKKDGLEDLRKARHFIDKYIEVVEAEAKRDAFADQLVRNQTCEGKKEQATPFPWPGSGELTGQSTGGLDRPAGFDHRR